MSRNLFTKYRNFQVDHLNQKLPPKTICFPSISNQQSKIKNSLLFLFAGILIACMSSVFAMDVVQVVSTTVQPNPFSPKINKASIEGKFRVLPLLPSVSEPRLQIQPLLRMNARVVNTAGKVVRVLTAETLVARSPGRPQFVEKSLTVTWDGKNAFGAVVANGQYTCRVVGDYVMAFKLTLPWGVWRWELVFASSNEARCRLTLDTTAPTLIVPQDQIVEATGADGAIVNYPAATATDAVTATPVITYSQASGTKFALGATVVTVTAKDAAGNITTAIFKVLVRDTTAPTLVMPPDQVVEATGPDGAIVTYPAATATDAVTAAPMIAYSQ
ncbi:MAG: HYR domain-containing protein, partial [Planctomycetota bacterium]